MLSKLKMIGWLTLTGSAFVTMAAAQTPQIAQMPQDVDYPVIAEATNDNVFVRSGRGPGYYHSGTLSAGDRVTVVEEVGGWAKILPLPTHYSWIHKNYVQLNPDDPSVGTVTGDNVRVWAGSDYIEPIRSFSIQARLNAGEVVELFDPAQPDTGDYYKIKVPSGGYLWVNSAELRYVEPFDPTPEPVDEPEPMDEPAAVDDRPLTLEERLGVDEATPLTPVDEPDEVEMVDEPDEPEEIVDEPEPAPEPEKPSKEMRFLRQCYELSDKINQELQKPLEDQDYSEFKEQLIAMLENPEIGRAEVYARHLLDRIERFEVALGVTDTLRRQEQRLEQIRTEIDKAHQSQLHRIPDPQGIALFTGTVRPSFVFTGRAGQQRYLLTDENGRIVCYMVPDNPTIAQRLEELTGSRIGIRGDLISDPEALVTTVSVTSIVQAD